MTREAQVIAVLNQKGGVGKTTVTCTLAHMLAMQNFDVLIVDLDPQGNVADLYGLDEGSETSRMLLGYQDWGTVSLGNDRPDTFGPLDYIDVLRANEMLSATKQRLVSEPFAVFRINRELQRVKDDYDYILLDLSPSFDQLHVSAMVAADWFLVVTKLDKLAVDGAEAVVRTALGLHKEDFQPPKLLGVLPNFWDRRTSLSLHYLTQLADAFKELLLPPIPIDTNIMRAAIAGQPITQFYPGARSVQGVYYNNADKPTGGYRQVFTELHNRLTGEQTEDAFWHWEGEK